MSYILQNLIFILLGLAGFCLASFIYYKKSRKQPLICPMRSDCNTVIQSQYSKFLGFPVEIMGVCYYSFIVIIHLFFIFEPALFYSSLWYFAFILVSLAAFIFSIYLLLVQLFDLQQWCVWCISSSFICAAIFCFSLYVYNINILLIN